MSEAFAKEVEVESPTMQDNMRVDHPVLLEYMQNGFKLGYSNEHICRITGLPASVVSAGRSKYSKKKPKK